VGSTITDGTGNCYAVKVDANNRIHAHAVEVNSDINILTATEGFVLADTKTVKLTTDGESAIIHITNNEGSDFVVDSLYFDIGQSTDGENEKGVTIKYYVDATSGTILDVPPVKASNLHFGSSRIVDVDVRRGSESKTIGGTAKIIEAIYPVMPSKNELGIPFALKRGVTVGVTCTPCAGNTDMNIRAGFTGYLADEI